MGLLDREENPDIISWLSHGRGFIIHDKKKFVDNVMSAYFQDSKYTSFTRRLRRWNFKIQTYGHKKASYFHPMFRRGCPDLCRSMKALPQWRKKKTNLRSNRKELKPRINEDQTALTSTACNQSVLDISSRPYIRSNSQLGGIDQQFKLITQNTESSFPCDETLRRIARMVTPTTDSSMESAQPVLMAELPIFPPIPSLNDPPSTQRVLAVTQLNSSLALPCITTFENLLQRRAQTEELLQRSTQTTDLLRRHLSLQNVLLGRNPPQFY